MFAQISNWYQEATDNLVDVKPLTTDDDCKIVHIAFTDESAGDPGFTFDTNTVTFYTGSGTTNGNMDNNFREKNIVCVFDKVTGNLILDNDKDREFKDTFQFQKFIAELKGGVPSPESKPDKTNFFNTENLLKVQNLLEQNTTNNYLTHYLDDKYLEEGWDFTGAVKFEKLTSDRIHKNPINEDLNSYNKDNRTIYFNNLVYKIFNVLTVENEPYFNGENIIL